MHWPFKNRVVTVIKWDKGFRSLYWHRNKYGFGRPGRKMAQGTNAYTISHLDRIW